MKASEKRQILRDALMGKSTALRPLQRQRLKASMPFLEVMGVVLVDSCPAPLMSLPVVDNESCIDSRSLQTQSLSEFISRWRERETFHKCAFGLLDPDDNQYDAVPLNAIYVRHMNYSNTYAPDGTVSDLRRLFLRSQDSLAKYPLLPIMIETDKDRFNWNVYKRRRA